jgi:hypothetical protein
MAPPGPGGKSGAGFRVPWPRRVLIPASPTATVRTAMLPFTKVPGVIRFAYVTLVSLGVLFGLGLETLLLTGHHYSAVGPVVFSVAAVAGGVVGAKAWYIAVHRGRKFDGWCIQGFVAGAAVVAGAAAFAGPGVPAGVSSARPRPRCCSASASAGRDASGPAAAPGGPPRHAGESGHRTGGSGAGESPRSCWRRRRR